MGPRVNLWAPQLYVFNQNNALAQGLIALFALFFIRLRALCDFFGDTRPYSIARLYTSGSNHTLAELFIHGIGVRINFIPCKERKIFPLGMSDHRIEGSGSASGTIHLRRQ